MKLLSSIALHLVAAIGILLPSSLSAQIINIDFLSVRESPETTAANYVGKGPAGGGTTFNGLAANDSTESDNITISGTDLVTAANVATSVDFTIASVGADHPTSSSPGLLTGNGGYVFINGSNNHATSATFTISGLGSATEEDLFFYTSTNTAVNNGTITLTGGTKVTYSATPSISPFTSSNTFEFEDVPVVDGSITGTFSVPAGHSGAEVLSGLTIESVPEPSAWAMMGLGVSFLLWRLRRHNNAV